MLRTHLRPRGSQRRESDCWGDPAAQTGNHAQPRVAAEARNITEYERGARKLAGPGVTRRQSGNRRGLNASPSAQEITRGRCFLRHTAGTLGYLHTGDLRAVQDFLGHADSRMTSRYAHVVDMAKKNPALFIPVKMG
jgi:integrase